MIERLLRFSAQQRHRLLKGQTREDQALRLLRTVMHETNLEIRLQKIAMFCWDQPTKPWLEPVGDIIDELTAWFRYFDGNQFIKHHEEDHDKS